MMAPFAPHSPLAAFRFRLLRSCVHKSGILIHVCVTVFFMLDKEILFVTQFSIIKLNSGVISPRGDYHGRKK
jgi:hypothetical protein